MTSIAKIHKIIISSTFFICAIHISPLVHTTGDNPTSGKETRDLFLLLRDYESKYLHIYYRWIQTNPYILPENNNVTTTNELDGHLVSSGCSAQCHILHRCFDLSSLSYSRIYNCSMRKRYLRETFEVRVYDGSLHPFLWLMRSPIIMDRLYVHGFKPSRGLSGREEGTNDFVRYVLTIGPQDCKINSRYYLIITAL
jgi:hypothetical protein